MRANIVFCCSLSRRFGRDAPHFGAVFACSHVQAHSFKSCRLVCTLAHGAGWRFVSASVLSGPVSRTVPKTVNQRRKRDLSGRREFFCVSPLRYYWVFVRV